MDKAFWSERWQTGDTGWDIGNISPPIKKFIDHRLTDKSIRILIPGCGNGYEGAYLHNKGFSNVFMMDIAPEPLAAFSKRASDFPKDHLLQMDFFDCELRFDLMIEQTFFCALPKELRTAYVAQADALLSDHGQIAGLMFGAEFENEGPPFGGSPTEYEKLFSEHFKINTMEPCLDSIEPRLGKELWVELSKK